jgi:hypothetical protein
MINATEERFISRIEGKKEVMYMNHRHENVKFVRPEYGQGQKLSKKHLDLKKVVSQARVLKASGITPTLEELFRTDAEWMQYPAAQIRCLLKHLSELNGYYYN